MMQLQKQHGGLADMYFDIKILHVLLSGILFAFVAWSVLPVIITAWQGDGVVLRSSLLRSSKTALVVVVPCAVVQGVLGMTLVSLDNGRWLSIECMVLVCGYFILGLLWLSLIAVWYRWHAMLSCSVHRCRQLSRRWLLIMSVCLSVMCCVLFVMLYFMSNFKILG